MLLNTYKEGEGKGKEGKGVHFDQKTLYSYNEKKSTGDQIINYSFIHPSAVFPLPSLPSLTLLSCRICGW